MCKKNKKNSHLKIWINVQMDIQTASGGGRTSSTTIFSSTYGLSLSKWVGLSPLSERLIWSAILPSSDTKHQPCEERERNVKTQFIITLDTRQHKSQECKAFQLNKACHVPTFNHQITCKSMLDDYMCKLNFKRIRCWCAWSLEWIGVNSTINSLLSY